MDSSTEYGYSPEADSDLSLSLRLAQEYPSVNVNQLRSLDIRNLSYADIKPLLDDYARSSTFAENEKRAKQEGRKWKGWKNVKALRKDFKDRYASLGYYDKKTRTWNVGDARYHELYAAYLLTENLVDLRNLKGEVPSYFYEVFCDLLRCVDPNLERPPWKKS